MTWLTKTTFGKSMFIPMPETRWSEIYLFEFNLFRRPIPNSTNLHDDVSL